MKIYLRVPPDLMEGKQQCLAVEVGIMGYWPIYTRADVDTLNPIPITAHEQDSALAASMFGWDTPAALPALAWSRRAQVAA